MHAYAFCQKTMRRILTLLVLLGTCWTCCEADRRDKICKLDKRVVYVDVSQEQEYVGPQRHLQLVESLAIALSSSPEQVIDDYSTTSQYLRRLDGENTTNDNKQALRYCICDTEGWIEEYHLYCPAPSGGTPRFTGCKVPFNYPMGDAKCIQSTPRDAFVMTAWPVSIAGFAMMLVIWAFAPQAYAMAQYCHRKPSLRRMTKKCCCWSASRQSLEDEEELSDEAIANRVMDEQVDEVIAFYRQQQEMDETERNRSTPNPFSQRRAFQRHLLYARIIDRVDLDWRRAWADYRTQQLEEWRRRELLLRTTTFQPKTATCLPKDASLDPLSVAKDFSSEEASCSICFHTVEVGEKIGKLPCRHIFHSDCLKQWLATGRRNTCPLCQAPDIAGVKQGGQTTSVSSPHENTVFDLVAASTTEGSSPTSSRHSSLIAVPTGGDLEMTARQQEQELSPSSSEPETAGTEPQAAET